MATFAEYAFDRILDRFAPVRETKAATAEFAPPAIFRSVGEAERFSVPDLTLPYNQADLYLRLSWLQAAISISAQTAAGTMLNVKRQWGEKLRDIPNHPFEKLLMKPNPLMSRFEFLEATFSWRDTTGNCYWYLNRPNANTAPIELWILPSHKVKPVPDGQSYLRGYLFYPDGINGSKPPIPLETWEVCHFKRFHPTNSFVGLSAIEALAVVAVGDLAMQKWNTNFFADDHAKLPGILAVKDPVPKPDWDKMKLDMKAQLGGTKRGLLMMQNVGPGGMEWIPTGMTQKDMEFILGRVASKEEIFMMFAPGLSSVLAVNATEANSEAGERTLQRYGIWPKHVAIAEKISNDILPSYGPNLVAEFDDVRRPDEALELLKIAEYAKSHSIDEVRQEFYEDDPLPERGHLLEAEIGKGVTDTRDPATVAAEQVQMVQDAQNDAPRVSPGEAAVATPKALDLERWQRKATKRLRSGRPAMCEFESDAITIDEAEMIGNALKAAVTAEQVAAVFGEVE